MRLLTTGIGSRKLGVWLSTSTPIQFHHSVAKQTQENANRGRRSPELDDQLLGMRTEIFARVVGEVRVAQRVEDVDQVATRDEDMRLRVAVHVRVRLPPHHRVVDIPLEVQTVKAECIARRLPRIPQLCNATHTQSVRREPSPN